MNNPIDFVVLWVDGNDPDWLKAKNQYSDKKVSSELNHASRYRDWDIFQYWFRGVEKYAPWVNKIHLVTAGHLPSWINKNHPKLNLIKHTDFMDARYLPTFSTRPIELNLHRIPNLANQFVYFNDDMHIVNTVQPEYFFQDGIPCDFGIRNPINGEQYNSVLYNSLTVIYKNFAQFNPSKHNFSNWFNPIYGKSLIRNICLSIWQSHIGYLSPHKPTPYILDNFKCVWDKEFELLDTVCQNKFRTRNDVNHQLFRWWRLTENKFKPYPQNKIVTELPMVNNAKTLNILKQRKYPILCLNDSNQIDFDLMKPIIQGIFQDIFPEKSAYEL